MSEAIETSINWDSPSCVTIGLHFRIHLHRKKRTYYPYLKFDCAGSLSCIFLASGCMATPVAHTQAENPMTLVSPSLVASVSWCLSTEMTLEFNTSSMPFLQSNTASDRAFLEDRSRNTIQELYAHSPSISLRGAEKLIIWECIVEALSPTQPLVNYRLSSWAKVLLSWTGLLHFICGASL